MASKAQIQAQIDEIQSGANYRANQMRPMLTDMLNYSSAGQTLVFPGLIANGTTSATTLVLSVGVNIVVTATNTNYACKLPQPVTGQRVTVVNKSNRTISLFPSNVGGQINNYPIDVPAIIPPDGKAYDFICVENPLPGAWIWSPPAIYQYDSGVLSFTTTDDSNNTWIAASNATYISERTGKLNSSSFADDGLNKPQFPAPPVVAGPLPNSTWFAVFRPSTPWNSITRIKVYTNIIPGNFPTISLGQSYSINYYTAGTTNFISAGDSGADSYIDNFDLLSQISGSASPGLTAEIGEPGTVFGEYVGPFNDIDYSFVGNQFISTNGVSDTWFSRYLSFYIAPKVIGAVKFQFFIEYY